MDNMLERLKGGLIVSCYAGPDFNAEMGVPETMVCVAKSCIAGGAKAIRTNWENVAAVKAAVDVPVIGLKKIYRSGDMISGDFRITPTLKEVEELLKAGADGVAVDGTIRERYDDQTLEQFIGAVKKEFGAFVIADISTAYSKNPLPFGTLPSPDPDYEIIRELRAAGVPHIVAEGRITNGEKMRKALEAGAHSVVIGTSITEPRKIVKTILLDAGL